MKLIAAGLSLSRAATAALIIAHSQAAEPVTDEPQAANACVNGQMAWLLRSGYNNGNPCNERDGIVKIRRVARLLVARDSYELYDFTYSFLAAVVRHAGARLLVLKNGRYVGLYDDDAAGGKWHVHGSRASVTWPETHATTALDFSAGPPDSIQVGDGGFTFFEKK